MIVAVIALIALLNLFLYISSRRKLSQLRIKLLKDERELLFNNFSNYFGEELDRKKLVKLAKIIRKKVIQKYGLKWVTTYNDLIVKVKKAAIPLELQNSLIDFFSKISEIEYAYNPDPRLAKEIKDDAIFLLKALLPSPGEVANEDKKEDNKKQKNLVSK